MIAVLKNEAKAYFYSPIAYIAIGLFILISSVYFFIGNVYNQSSDLSSLFGTMAVFLVFIIPILTARTIAEDRRNGMEIVWVTSPTKLYQIVLGKYVAVLSVFLLLTAVTLIYPIILGIFSHFSIVPVIGQYTGFLLLGAAMIAFGVFASSLTENIVVASIISFVGLLIMMIVQPLGSTVGGALAKILDALSLFSKDDDLNRGVFSLDAIVYYLSFIFVFLFLTVKVIEQRRWNRRQ